MALQTWATWGKEDSAPTPPSALQGGDPKESLTPYQGGRDAQGRLSPQGPGWWETSLWGSTSRDLRLICVPKVGKGTQAGGSRQVREAAPLHQVAPAAQASQAQAAPAQPGRPPGCPPPHTASLPAVPQLQARLMSSRRLFFCAFLKIPDLHLKQREGRECLFPSPQRL